MNYIKIAFGNKEYKVGPSSRGIILVEEAFGCGIDEVKETYGNICKVFYYLLKACNQESFTLTFEEFLDLIDEHNEALQEFNDFLVKVNSEKKPEKKRPNGTKTLPRKKP
jgi:hypothetical protein